MLLAAGRGERLRPFTDRWPKPLLQVGGQPLIAHHLRKLAAAGLRDIVVNVAYRGGQIRDALGDGARYGVNISYSVEVPGELDTGGGIANALHLLGPRRFIVISSDIVSDIDYGALAADAGTDNDTHIILVGNPAHHPTGDFGLQQGRVVEFGPRLTYAGIGVFCPESFACRKQRRFPLSAVLHDAIRVGRATGEYHHGQWTDVGRPRTLAAVRQGDVFK